MTTKQRVGIVGCGAATERLHLPALATLGVRPVLLVDPQIDRARQLAAKFGIPNTAPDYGAHVGDLDAVIVAAPHHVHASVSVDLLRRGIHVMVEKPMAVTSAECDDVIAAARQSGAVVAVGLMPRF